MYVARTENTYSQREIDKAYQAFRRTHPEQPPVPYLNTSQDYERVITELVGDSLADLREIDNLKTFVEETVDGCRYMLFPQYHYEIYLVSPYTKELRTLTRQSITGGIEFIARMSLIKSLQARLIDIFRVDDA